MTRTHRAELLQFVSRKLSINITASQLGSVSAYGDLLRLIRSFVTKMFVEARFRCQTTLMCRCSSPFVVAQDVETRACVNTDAFVVLQLAAEEESPDAQYALAVLAHSGEPRFNLAADLALELQLLLSAREMGYTLAIDRLGQLFETGSDVLPANAQQAMHQYQESGSPFAQARLRVLRAEAGPAGTTKRRSDSISRSRSASVSDQRARDPPASTIPLWQKVAGGVGALSVVAAVVYAMKSSGGHAGTNE